MKTYNFYSAGVKGYAVINSELTYVEITEVIIKPNEIIYNVKNEENAYTINDLVLYSSESSYVDGDVKKTDQNFSSLDLLTRADNNISDGGWEDSQHRVYYKNELGELDFFFADDVDLEFRLTEFHSYLTAPIDCDFYVYREDYFHFNNLVVVNEDGEKTVRKSAKALLQLEDEQKELVDKFSELLNEMHRKDIQVIYEFNQEKFSFVDKRKCSLGYSGYGDDERDLTWHISYRDADRLNLLTTVSAGFEYSAPASDDDDYIFAKFL